MAEEKEKVVEKTKVKKDDNVTKVNMGKKPEPKETITKVNLDKPPVKVEEEVKNEAVEEVVVVNPDPEVVETKEQKETPIVEDVTNEKVTEIKEEQVEQAIEEAQQTGTVLPENIQKLVNFMDETGGDLKDYVNLNRDISNMDDSDVLDEYYRETKSHLTPDERGFLLQESYGYDEEVDDPKEIKRKKIALKEQVAEARAHLDGQKSKYYEDIKAGSRLTQEQQKAVNFFNRYNKESEEQSKLNEVTKKAFQQKTEKVFNDKFKGFDYKVGDKKFRFNVKDVEKVKNTQTDINNFVNKFVNEGEQTISDAAGYHKSLFTAMNPDTIAKHFYEQGKADAIKDTIARDKNIDLNPRQTHGEISAGGIKVKVLGDTAKDFKYKIRRKK